MIEESNSKKNIDNVLAHKILYYGYIEDLLGKEQEVFYGNFENVFQLDELLRKRYPQLEEVSYLWVQDKNIVHKSTEITGEVLALLPPFAGG